MPQAQWITLAEGFPCGLVTNRPPQDLSENQSPAATNLDATDEGFLKVGTIPTADTRVVKTYEIGDPAVTYEWHYGRLWRLDTTSDSIVYGAPEYTAVYFRQGPGEIPLPHDAQDPLKMLEIGVGGLIVFKSTGAYILRNASDRGGRFDMSEMIQAAYVSTDTHAVSWNGDVYFANAEGFFSINANGQVKELSIPLRGSLPTAAAVKVDYATGRFTIGSTHCYDAPADRWLQYGDDFLFTSRTMRGDDGEPFCVERVAFEYENSDADYQEVEFQTQIEERGWSDTEKAELVYERGTHRRVELALQQQDKGREWKMKITSLPSSVKISKILVYADMRYDENSRGS